MPDDQSSRVLAILLGASTFPNAPNLAEGRAFSISAADVKQYLIDEQGLGLARKNILTLFDDSRSPSDQLMEVATFLVRRGQELKAQGVTPEDLLIYYVGHGLFTKGDQAYCLAVRSTNEINEGATSIRASDLAGVIKENASFLRRYLILDCCFAASIHHEFQSGALTAATVQVANEFPKRGTALLCSSNAREPSLAPQGLDHTMFTHALIEVLRKGNKGAGEKLSISELGYLIQENLRNAYPDGWVRPEVHSPDQREGDIGHIPLFPNHAYRDAIAEKEREELERAKAAAERARQQAAEQERLDREELERRIEAAAKAAEEQAAQEKAEKERVTREAAQAKAREAKKERDRIAREKAAAEEAAAAEKAAQEKAERERLEREQIAALKAAQEQAAKEKAEKARIAREAAEANLREVRKERDRIAKEKATAEKAAQEKLEQERIAREAAEAEKETERKRLAAEKAKADRAARQETEKKLKVALQEAAERAASEAEERKPAEDGESKPRRKAALKVVPPQAESVDAVPETITLPRRRKDSSAIPIAPPEHVDMPDSPSGTLFRATEAATGSDPGAKGIKTVAGIVVLALIIIGGLWYASRSGSQSNSDTYNTQGTQPSPAPVQDGTTTPSNGANSGAAEAPLAVPNYTLEAALTGPTREVMAVAFNPKDHTLIAAGVDKKLFVWSPSDWTKSEPLTRVANQDTAWFVTFSRDGSMFAAGGLDTGVEVWKAADRSQILPLLGAPWVDSSYAAAFSPDNKYIAWGDTTQPKAGENGLQFNVYLWDLPGQKAYGPLFPGKEALGMAFSPDGQKLVVTGSTGLVVYDTADWKQKYEVAVKGQGLAISPDGRLIATGGMDKTITIVDAASGTTVQTIPCKAQVRALAFSPDGGLLAAGLWGEVLLWKTRDWSLAQTLAHPAPAGSIGSGVNAVAFSSDGQWLATGGQDKVRVRLWKANR